MNTIRLKTIALILFVILSIAGCKKDDSMNPGQNIASQINSFPNETLSFDETASILYLREEEKLAYDV